MKICEVIEKVNALYPNAYEADTKQMTDWCNELTAILCEQLVPAYESFVQTYSGKIALPDGVAYEDVVKVYRNGEVLDKLDARTISGSSFKEGDKVIVVYRAKPTLAETGDADAETVCAFPHDLMYVDYLCAQIAFYQNDLSDYNKFILSYNQRLKDFERTVVEKLPKQPDKVFTNLW